MATRAPSGGKRKSSAPTPDPSTFVQNSVKFVQAASLFQRRRDNNVWQATTKGYARLQVTQITTSTATTRSVKHTLTAQEGSSEVLNVTLNPSMRVKRTTTFVQIILGNSESSILGVRLTAQEQAVQLENCLSQIAPARASPILASKSSTGSTSSADNISMGSTGSDTTDGVEGGAGQPRRPAKRLAPAPPRPVPASQLTSSAPASVLTQAMTTTDGAAAKNTRHPPPANPTPYKPGSAPPSRSPSVGSLDAPLSTPSSPNKKLQKRQAPAPPPGGVGARRVTVASIAVTPAAQDTVPDKRQLRKVTSDSRVGAESPRRRAPLAPAPFIPMQKAQSMQALNQMPNASAGDAATSAGPKTREAPGKLSTSSSDSSVLPGRARLTSDPSMRQPQPLPAKLQRPRSPPNLPPPPPPPAPASSVPAPAPAGDDGSGESAFEFAEPPKTLDDSMLRDNPLDSSLNSIGEEEERLSVETSPVHAAAEPKPASVFTLSSAVGMAAEDSPVFAHPRQGSYDSVEGADPFALPPPADDSLPAMPENGDDGQPVRSSTPVSSVMPTEMSETPSTIRLSVAYTEECDSLLEDLENMTGELGEDTTDTRTARSASYAVTLGDEEDEEASGNGAQMLSYKVIDEDLAACKSTITLAAGSVSEQEAQELTDGPAKAETSSPLGSMPPPSTAVKPAKSAPPVTSSKPKRPALSTRTFEPRVNTKPPGGEQPAEKQPAVQPKPEKRPTSTAASGAASSSSSPGFKRVPPATAPKLSGGDGKRHSSHGLDSPKESRGRSGSGSRWRSGSLGGSLDRDEDSPRLVIKQVSSLAVAPAKARVLAPRFTGSREGLDVTDGDEDSTAAEPNAANAATTSPASGEADSSRPTGPDSTVTVVPRPKPEVREAHSKSLTPNRSSGNMLVLNMLPSSKPGMESKSKGGTMLFNLPPPPLGKSPFAMRKQPRPQSSARLSGEFPPPPMAPDGIGLYDLAAMPTSLPSPPRDLTGYKAAPDEMGGSPRPELPPPPPAQLDLVPAPSDPEPAVSAQTPSTPSGKKPPPTASKKPVPATAPKSRKPPASTPQSDGPSAELAAKLQRRMNVEESSEAKEEVPVQPPGVACVHIMKPGNDTALGSPETTAESGSPPAPAPKPTAVTKADVLTTPAAAVAAAAAEKVLAPVVAAEKVPRVNEQVEEGMDAGTDSSKPALAAEASDSSASAAVPESLLEEEMHIPPASVETAELSPQPQQAASPPSPTVPASAAVQLPELAAAEDVLPPPPDSLLAETPEDGSTSLFAEKQTTDPAVETQHKQCPDVGEQTPATEATVTDELAPAADPPVPDKVSTDVTSPTADLPPPPEEEDEQPPPGTNSPTEVTLPPPRSEQEEPAPAESTPLPEPAVASADNTADAPSTPSNEAPPRAVRFSSDTADKAPRPVLQVANIKEDDDDDYFLSPSVPNLDPYDMSFSPSVAALDLPDIPDGMAAPDDLDELDFGDELVVQSGFESEEVAVSSAALPPPPGGDVSPGIQKAADVSEAVAGDGLQASAHPEESADPSSILPEDSPLPSMAEDAGKSGETPSPGTDKLPEEEPLAESASVAAVEPTTEEATPPPPAAPSAAQEDPPTAETASEAPSSTQQESSAAEPETPQPETPQPSDQCTAEVKSDPAPKVAENLESVECDGSHCSGPSPSPTVEPTEVGATSPPEETHVESQPNPAVVEAVPHHTTSAEQPSKEAVVEAQQPDGSPTEQAPASVNPPADAEPQATEVVATQPGSADAHLADEESQDKEAAEARGTSADSEVIPDADTASSATNSPSQPANQDSATDMAEECKAADSAPAAKAESAIEQQQQQQQQQQQEEEIESPKAEDDASALSAPSSDQESDPTSKADRAPAEPVRQEEPAADDQADSEKPGDEQPATDVSEAPAAVGGAPSPAPVASKPSAHGTDGKEECGAVVEAACEEADSELEKASELTANSSPSLLAEAATEEAKPGQGAGDKTATEQAKPGQGAGDKTATEEVKPDSTGDEQQTSEEPSGEPAAHSPDEEDKPGETAEREPATSTSADLPPVAADINPAPAAEAASTGEAINPTATQEAEATPASEAACTSDQSKADEAVASTGKLPTEGGNESAEQDSGKSVSEGAEPSPGNEDETKAMDETVVSESSPPVTVPAAETAPSIATSIEAANSDQAKPSTPLEDKTETTPGDAEKEATPSAGADIEATTAAKTQTAEPPKPETAEEKPEEDTSSQESTPAAAATAGASDDSHPGKNSEAEQSEPKKKDQPDLEKESEDTESVETTPAHTGSGDPAASSETPAATGESNSAGDKKKDGAGGKAVPPALSNLSNSSPHSVSESPSPVPMSPPPLPTTSPPPLPMTPSPSLDEQELERAALAKPGRVRFAGAEGDAASEEDARPSAGAAAAAQGPKAPPPPPMPKPKTKKEIRGSLLKRNQKQVESYDDLDEVLDDIRKDHKTRLRKVSTEKPEAKAERREQELVDGTDMTSALFKSLKNRRFRISDTLRVKRASGVLDADEDWENE